MGLVFSLLQQGPKFLSLPADEWPIKSARNVQRMVCGGRVQAFNEDKVGIPLLPYRALISTLLVHEAHSKGHEGVAATLLKVRKKARIIKGRIAQKVTIV